MLPSISDRKEAHMELHRTSWLYFVAYWYTHRARRPKTSSMCVFFWRILFGTVLGIFVVAVCSMAAALISFLMYAFLNGLWVERHALIANAPYIGLGLVSIIGALALLIGLNVFFRTNSGRVITEYVKAKKQKVCPIIKFT